MIKYKIIISLLILLPLSFSCFSCFSPNRQKAIESLQNSVVSISITSASGEEEPNSLGTGFFIRNDLLATAFHVYEDHLENIKARGEGSRFIARKSSRDKKKSFSIPLTFVLGDKENDLAIFKFDDADIKEQWKDFVINPLTISERKVSIGEEITTAGYHDEYSQPSSSLGIVSQITEDNNIRSDLTILPGMSGSPLLSLRTNEIVGVNHRVSMVKGAQVRLAISVQATHLIVLIERVKTLENIEKLKDAQNKIQR